MNRENHPNLGKIINSSPDLKQRILGIAEHAYFVVVLGGMAMLSFSDNPTMKTIGIAVNVGELLRIMTHHDEDV